ncbi:hypothetical protein [Lysobacter antibioticus]|uniref:Phage terminase small subunit n=1 Tax=Lysobacter antibioticus TaxID=84531 RepID=A0A0S2F7K7_LYSAN|nr:hypothetical protein [Lysobacter antibioticus]ALN79499.1 hypothetical protein LA76x_1342 [Lysobacter antibioticus]
MKPLYSDDLAAAICERLASGETLTSICRAEGMPAPRTVREWSRDNSEFGKAYRQAMESGCHALLDETLDIADNKNEPADSRKLRIWARHELAARKRPDLFGKMVKMEHTGADGGPMKHESTVTLDPGEAYRRLLNPDA